MTPRVAIALLVFVLGLTGCGDSRRAASPESHALSCAVDHRFNTQRARLLIATFAGDGATGTDASNILEAAVRRFDDERTPDEQKRLFELARLTDVVASHDDARVCAERLGADAVVWGRVVKNPPASAPASAPRTVRVGSVRAEGGSHVLIGNVVTGPDAFSTIPSVTLRSHGGWLMTSSRLDLHSLADIDFPHVAADRSLFLIPFIAGVVAFAHGDRPSAISMLALARKGVAESDGQAHVFAGTYLGAVHLYAHDLVAAVDDLSVPRADLDAAPPDIAWRNRILLGLAGEQSGDLRLARDAYGLASSLEPRVGREVAGTAPLALAATLLEMGDADGAERVLDGVPVGDACDPTTDPECFPSLAKVGTAMSLRLLTVAMTRDVAASQACATNVHEFAQQATDKLRRSHLATEDLVETSPDEMPSVVQMNMRKPGMCAFGQLDDAALRVLLGATFDVEQFAHERPRSVRADLERIMSNIRQGRGSLGRALQKIPVELSQPYLANMICGYSLAARAAGAHEAAAALAREAIRALGTFGSPLLHAQADLVLASAEGGAAGRVHEDLMTLRKAMGPNAPAVRAWEEFARTGQLPANRRSPGAGRLSCPAVRFNSGAR